MPFSERLTLTYSPFFPNAERVWGLSRVRVFSSVGISPSGPVRCMGLVSCPVSWGLSSSHVTTSGDYVLHAMPAIDSVPHSRTERVWKV